MPSVLEVHMGDVQPLEALKYPNAVNLQDLETHPPLPTNQMLDN